MEITTSAVPQYHYTEGDNKMPAKLTQEEFINKSMVIHGLKYDYSKVEFANVRSKVKIICKRHGGFEQVADSHLHGHGCKECRIENSRWSQSEFIKECRKIHGNKYDYSLSLYDGFLKKITIVCKKHGKFQQSPSHHLHGWGCQKCGIDSCKWDREELIKKCSCVHNDKYDYSLVIYKGINKKVTIVCPKHGKFRQKASHHLCGNECPRCSRKISKSEQKWLETCGVPEGDKNRQVRIPISNNKSVRVDGYLPKGKIIYEFYGDYWHGNPNKYHPCNINKNSKKTFGELYEETKTREKELKGLGYNLITIWESDFKNKITS